MVAAVPAPARRGLPKLPPELALTFTPPTEAERADMLAGVDKLVRKVVHGSKVRKADRQDACQAVMLKMWEVSARFDPNGPAKWATFATYVARTECRRFVGESYESIGDALDVPVDELAGGRADTRAWRDAEDGVSDEDADLVNDLAGRSARSSSLAFSTRSPTRSGSSSS